MLKAMSLMQGAPAGLTNAIKPQNLLTPARLSVK